MLHNGTFLFVSYIAVIIIIDLVMRYKEYLYKKQMEESKIRWY